MPFEKFELKTRGGHKFTAWQLLGGYTGSSRSSSKLAIITHPITNAGKGGRKLHHRVCCTPLHRHLVDAGYSVVVYEAHTFAAQTNGELEVSLPSP